MRARARSARYLRFGLMALICVVAEASAHPTEVSQQIRRAGSQATITGSADNFVGRVRVTPLSQADAEIPAASAYVTFAPGAHSAWHTHPKGQYLVVISGLGVTQEWGQPAQEIHPGDVVWCPPGVKHWHGAVAANEMTHLAITGVDDGTSVTWMEAVNDEQYNAR